ncbi:hypothetical protein JCM8547_006636 [Rhodosporidiobolus lusitaniae]
MDTYASASLDSISYFSPFNKNGFPALCNGAGFTDVDAYCASGTSEVCCGLCPNTSVAGVGQFVWAILSYGIGSFSYTLSPGAVWGLAVMQAVNANAFIAAGLIRVGAGATDGGMTLWHTQFLWPQALGFIFIMAPAIFAPQWSRVGLTHRDMTEKLRQVDNLDSSRDPSYKAARDIELSLIKKSHHFWSFPVFVLWIICMAVWTGMYAWVTLGDIEYSQSNCQGELDYTLSPTMATFILGGIAWGLLVIDGIAFWKKMGASDLIIATFIKTPRDRTFDEHRKLERKITIGVTVFLFVFWTALNCWMYVEGLNKFLLTGADFITFGQVEQFTALFPDVLGFFAAIAAYLKSTDEHREERELALDSASVKSVRGSTMGRSRSTRSTMSRNFGFSDDEDEPVPPHSSDSDAEAAGRRRSDGHLLHPTFAEEPSPTETHHHYPPSVPSVRNSRIPRSSVPDAEQDQSTDEEHDHRDRRRRSTFPRASARHTEMHPSATAPIFSPVDYHSPSAQSSSTSFPQTQPFPNHHLPDLRAGFEPHYVYPPHQHQEDRRTSSAHDHESQMHTLRKRSQSRRRTRFEGRGGEESEEEEDERGLIRRG